MVLYDYFIKLVERSMLTELSFLLKFFFLLEKKALYFLLLKMIKVQTVSHTSTEVIMDNFMIL